MKRLYVLCAALLLTIPLIAQHQTDPDKAVAGGGNLPTGWKGRLDGAGTSLAGVKVAPMAGGLHFQTGPAGIYYKPADKLTGAYEVHATFTQLEPAAHPEAYGLFIGGLGLDGASQKYTYFLLRQDGKFLVKKRAGTETPTVTNWSDNAAVKKADASGKMANTLAIQVAKDKVRFLVNGTEVTTMVPAPAETDGIAGLRINHNLNVNVEGFAAASR